MDRDSADEKWPHSTSAENEAEEDEEEALSLCDLPISEPNQSRKDEAQSVKTKTGGEDFDFGSCGGSVFTDSVMCAADEVFFRGQILPLRHSVSSDSGLAVFRRDSRNPSRCVSRSESMDHCYSSGGFTCVSSRSSSIRSHHSSSSGSSTTAAAATTTTANHKQRFRNQFHSHPSPTPQIRQSSSWYGNVGHRSSRKKSTLWSFFRVGLVRTPGIELQDLKVRNNNNGGNSSKSFGSRNSNSSTSSSKNGSDIDKRIKKQRLFGINGGALFGGGCKCSVNAVDSTVTVPSRVVVIVKSESNDEGHGNVAKDQEEVKKTTKQKHGKQTMSRHRTFEWLKELSLAGVPDEA